MIINVMSEDIAEDASYKLEDLTAIISVRNMDDDCVPFCESKSLYAVKTLFFDDTDQETPNCFSPEKAEEIREFLQSVLGHVDRLIVHCENGISRSAGIAAAILKTLTGDDTPITGDHWFVPNKLCYSLTMQALNDAEGKSLIGNTECEFRDNIL